MQENPLRMQRNSDACVMARGREHNFINQNNNRGLHSSTQKIKIISADNRDQSYSRS